MEKELEFLFELESVYIPQHLMEAIAGSFKECHQCAEPLVEAWSSQFNDHREAPKLSEADIKMALDQWEANNARTGLPFDRVRTERQLRANPGRFMAQINNMKRHVAAGHQMSTKISSAVPVSKDMINSIRIRFYKAALSMIANEFRKYDIPFDYEFELNQVIGNENRLFGAQKGRLDLDGQVPRFTSFDGMLANKNVNTLRNSNSTFNELFKRLSNVKTTLEKAKEAGTFMLVKDRLQKQAEKSTEIRKLGAAKAAAHPRLSKDDWAKFRVEEAKRKAAEDANKPKPVVSPATTAKIEEKYGTTDESQVPTVGESILSFAKRMKKGDGELPMEFASRLHQEMLKEYSEEDIADEINWLQKDPKNGPVCDAAIEKVSRMMIAPKDVKAYTLWRALQDIEEAKKARA